MTDPRELDKGICASEPIHIPGSIQPGGVLLAADPVDFVVKVCSANTTALFCGGAGAADPDVLGRPLGDLLGQEAVTGVRRAGAVTGLPGNSPYRVALQVQGKRIEASFHLHAGMLIAELEEIGRYGHPPPPSHAELEQAILRVRSAAGMATLARTMSEEVRHFTGFERVLVYRFDSDWNGEAVGEARDTDIPSLMGLRFPASDIPSQARSLYTRNRSRFVTDRDYVPVPLIAQAGYPPVDVDLTYAQFRSLSPIHLEYQKNLGVNGSMSVSILVGGKLWGLLIGHHRQRHYIPPDTGSAIRSLTDVFALRINELENQEIWRRQQIHLELQSKLLCQMAGQSDWIEAITGQTSGTSQPASILDLFGATGAAIVSGGTIRTVGVTPPSGDILSLAQWLQSRNALGRTSASSRLSVEFAPAAAYKEQASGVLAARVQGSDHVWLLWFRPEEAGTVSWSGNPAAPAEVGPQGEVVPRRSFERWVEKRIGHAVPWEAWHCDIASTLSGAIQDVILRHGREVRVLKEKQHQLADALETAQSLLREKDLLVREIDHRVKNSLQIVASVLQMRERTVTDPEARQALAECRARVMSVARVHQSLYGSSNAKMIDLGETLHVICNDLTAMTLPSALDVTVERDILVPSDAGLSLALVTTELITNAFKHGCPPGADCRITVSLDRPDPDTIRLSISDKGPGLPLDWHQRGSSGLGMRLVDALLKRINAHLEVASRQGARFTVLLTQSPSVAAV